MPDERVAPSDARTHARTHLVAEPVTDVVLVRVRIRVRVRVRARARARARARVRVRVTWSPA
jgi:hypothetical protein